MQLPDELTAEQSAAIIACLRIFAELGEDKNEDEQERTKDADSMGIGAASLARHNGGTLTPKVNTDASTV